MRKQVVLDENIPGKFEDLIKICFCDVDITTVSRLGYKGTADVDWMGELSKRYPRPIVISCDRNISKKRFEYDVLKSSGLTFVVFASNWANLKVHEKAWRLIKHWEQFHEVAQMADSDVYHIFEVDLVSFSIQENRS